MAISVRQSTNADFNSSLTTNTRAFNTNSQLAGSLNICGVTYPNTVTATCADNINGAYTEALTFNDTVQGYKISIFYRVNIAATAVSTNTVTVTYSSAVAGNSISIAEVLGITTTGNPVNVTAAAKGTGTSASSGSVSTTKANCLLYGFGAPSNAFTAAGSGYTLLNPITGNGVLSETKIVTSTGSQAATGTCSSSNWAIVLVAFSDTANGVNQQATATILPRMAMVNTEQIRRNAIQTISTGITVVATSRGLHNATTTVPAALAIVSAAVATHNAITSMAVGTSMVGNDHRFGPLTSSISTGITIVASQRILRNATAGIQNQVFLFRYAQVSPRATIAVNPFIFRNATVGIAAGTSTVVSLSILGQNTALLQPLITLLAVGRRLIPDATSLGAGIVVGPVAKVTHSAASNVSTGASCAPPSKVIHTDTCSIARSVTVFASGSRSTQGSAIVNIQSGAILAVTGKVLHNATCTAVSTGAVFGNARQRIEGQTTVAASSVVLQTQHVNNTLVLVRQLLMVLNANQLKAPPQTSVCSIQSNIAFSKNAAFVTHRTSVVIYTGRQPIASTRISSGVVMGLVPHIALGSARCAILTGLSTTPQTQSNIAVKINLLVASKVTYNVSCAIALGSSVVGGGTQSHIQATLLVGSTMVATPTMKINNPVTIHPTISVVANGSRSTQGTGIDIVSNRATIGATSRVNRIVNVGVGIGVTILARGNQRYSGATTVGSRAAIVANGFKNLVLQFVTVNSSIGLGLIGSIRRSGKVVVGVGIGMVGVPTNQKVNSGNLFPRAILTVLGAAMRRTSAGMGVGGSVIATARGVYSGAEQIRTGVAIGTAGGRVNHFAALAIGAGTRVTVSSTTSTQHGSVAIGSGVVLGVVAQVVHGAAIHVAAGVTLVPTIRILRRGTVLVTTHLTPTAVDTTVYRGSLVVGAGSFLTLGIDHLFPARLAINTGGGIEGVPTLRSMARVTAGRGIGISATAKADMFAADNLLVGIGTLFKGGKGIRLQASIQTALVGTVVHGEDNFFAGSNTTITPTIPIAEVKVLDPKGTVTLLP